jgi:predicted nuclease with TOPRIM domain
MEQKVKFIIIGLVGATLVSLVLFLQTFSAKQQLLNERDKIKAALDQKGQEAKRLENKIRSLEGEKSSINRQMDQLFEERQDSQKKFQLLVREKEELAQKLKKMQQQQAVAPTPSSESLPASSTDSYWGAILKAKADLEMQLANVRSELKSLQLTSEQMQREKSTVDLEITSLKRQNEDLRRDMEYGQKILDSISQELVREKNDKARIQESLRAAKNENTVLLREVKSLNNHKAELERKVQGLEEEKLTATHRLNEMETMLTEKVTQINNLKSQLSGSIASGAAVEGAAGAAKDSVELAPIVVRPTTVAEGPLAESVSVSAAQIGKILAVVKENNFVIIDLGEDAGLKLGDSFTVYRDDKPIANLEVIQIRKKISACDIKNQNSAIRVGDIVK